MIKMSGTDPKHPEGGFAAFEHTAQRVEEDAEIKAEALPDETPGNATPSADGAADQISSAGQAAANRVESVAGRAADRVEEAGKAGVETLETSVSGAAERVRTAGGAIAGKARDMTEKAAGLADQASDQMTSARATATDAVDQRPLTALLIAGAVGWVLGMLANTRR